MKDKQRIEKSRIAQPTPTIWALTEDQKITYQSLFILYLMVKKEYRFSNVLTSNLRLVEEAINFLENKKLIEHKAIDGKVKKVLGIKYGQEDPDWIYSPTAAATDVIQQYEYRYIEFLRFYDVFAHVDPEAGTFAMENMGKLLVEEDEESWNIYKSLSRWHDYRIPVMVFKGLDPREMIFFSMMAEGQFDPSEKDDTHQWAVRLFSEELWQDMYKILASAPRWEDQGAEGVKPKKIMKTIIKMGAAIVKEQHEYLDKVLEDNDTSGHHASDNEEYTTTVIEEYYDDPVYYGGAYYTPFSSPMFWLGMAILI